MNKERETYFIDGDGLRLQDLKAIMDGTVEVKLSPNSIEKINFSRNFVQQLVQDGKRVYGITTGFGKFSDVVIPQKETMELQENLIKSHACGVGEPLPEPIVRAMMVLRANALAKGYSGVRLSTIQLLLDMLNHGIHPVIPEQGSLGASGDLAPLSHMVLSMLGKGEVTYQGVRMPSSEALSKAGLKPIQLIEKEGLALINGTQAMTGIAGYAWHHIEQIIHYADLISALTVEALHGIPKAYHSLVQQVRPHPGQIETAKKLLLYLEGSKEVSEPGQLRVQDPYTLRCIPQVHGATKDAFSYFTQVLSIEINSATDNPLIFAEEDEVISGGNFHGQPVAFAADFMGIALSELANISERRIERLVNPALSGLPAFLTRHGGLHSGMMIAQYTAASLVSENKVLAHPASVDSIPSSANQEDHVSMGTIGARKLVKIMENVYHVLSIEWLCAAQGVEFGSKRLGKGTTIAYELLRSSIPSLDEDRILHEDIIMAKNLLKSGELKKAIEAAMK